MEKVILFDVICGDVTLYSATKISNVTLRDQICSIRDVIYIDVMNGYRDIRMAFITENEDNCYNTTIIINKEDMIEFNNECDLRISGEELYDFIEDKNVILENTSFGIKDLYDLLLEWKEEANL